MSSYNVGDMIRLTRQAVGMSQEELCDTICSIQTLSRIENGKVKVKRKIYQKLMEKMGRDGTKNFSVLSTEHFEVLDVMLDINNLLFHFEYEMAEEKLSVLKNTLSMKEDINYIFVRECEIIIDGGLGRISEEERLEELEELIALTIPNYKHFLYGVYPFMHEEIMIIMNIANAYGEIKNFQMAIDISYMLLRSLNSGYMRQDDTMQITVMLISNIARFWGGLGKRDKAIRMCWNAIHKAKKNSLYTILPKCYGEIAWNMMKQIEKGDRVETDREFCKQYLRQGYAVAVLSKQKTCEKIIQSIYEEYFEEDIYCLGMGIYGESSSSSLSG